MKYHNSSTYVSLQAAWLHIAYITTITIYGIINGFTDDFWLFTVIIYFIILFVLACSVFGAKIITLGKSLYIISANNPYKSTYMPFESIRKLIVQDSLYGMRLVIEGKDGHKIRTYPHDLPSLVTLLKSNGIKTCQA